MCGRFANSESIPAMARAWTAAIVEGAETGWTPNDDVRPTNQIAVLLEGAGRPRRIGLMRWGWPRDFAESGQLTVARSDAIRTKATYRDVWTRRRCLLPATAWYEWQEPPAGSPKKTRKTKHRFHPAADGPWAMAGLWEPLATGGAAALLITVDAHPGVMAIHDRMPAIVPLAGAEAWLLGSPDEATAVLAPMPAMAEPVA